LLFCRVHRYISIIVKRCDAGIYLQDINKSDIEQHKVTQPTGIDSININKSDDQNSDDDDDDDDSSDCTNDNSNNNAYCIFYFYGSIIWIFFILS